jgi:hypothetical protein
VARLDDIVRNVNVVDKMPSNGHHPAEPAAPAAPTLDDVLASQEQEAIARIMGGRANLAVLRLQAEEAELQEKIAEAQEKRAQRSGGGGGGGELAAIVGPMLEAASAREAALMAQLEQTRSQLLEASREEMAEMREQMRNLAGSANDPVAQANNLKTLLESLKMFLPEPAPQANSAADMLAIMRAQQEERVTEARLAMERARDEREQQYRMEILNNEKMRMAGIAAMVDKYLPNMFNRGVDLIADARKGGGEKAAPDTKQIAAPPPDVTVAICPDCEGETTVPLGETEFECAKCGKELELAPPAPPELTVLTTPPSRRSTPSAIG